jgi:hypothetical protein
VQSKDIDPVMWIQMIGADGVEIMAKFDLENGKISEVKEVESGKKTADALEEFKAVLANALAG